eukprot:1856961-Pleurochrysis_carterae.AAC.2
MQGNKTRSVLSQRMFPRLFGLAHRILTHDKPEAHIVLAVVDELHRRLLRVDNFECAEIEAIDVGVWPGDVDVDGVGLRLERHIKRLLHAELGVRVGNLDGKGLLDSLCFAREEGDADVGGVSRPQRPGRLVQTEVLVSGLGARTNELGERFLADGPREREGRFRRKSDAFRVAALEQQPLKLDGGCRDLHCGRRANGGEREEHRLRIVLDGAHELLLVQAVGVGLHRRDGHGEDRLTRGAQRRGSRRRRVPAAVCARWALALRALRLAACVRVCGVESGQRRAKASAAVQKGEVDGEGEGSVVGDVQLLRVLGVRLIVGALPADQKRAKLERAPIDHKRLARLQHVARLDLSSETKAA